MKHIPLVDLAPQHEAIKRDVERGFASVLERAAFVLVQDGKAWRHAGLDREPLQLSSRAEAIDGQPTATGRSRGPTRG